MVGYEVSFELIFYWQMAVNTAVDTVLSSRVNAFEGVAGAAAAKQ
jgi:hypothetical protein